MLDFGFSEIVLTSAIALIVLGPEKLPKVARQVGNWMGRARAMARQLTEQLEREVDAVDLVKAAKAKSSPMHASPPRMPASLPPAELVAAAAPAKPEPAPYVGSAPAAAVPEAAAPYTTQPAIPPHGADWHPAPLDHKPRDG